MNKQTPKYAVLIRKTNMHLYVSPEILIECEGINDFEDAKKTEILVNAGALIKVYPLLTCEVNNSKKLCTVAVLDFTDNNLPTYEVLYVCPQYNLKQVDEHLLPFILGIEDPGQRLSKVHNDHFCNWLKSLKENDIVSVSGQIFNKPGANFICIIRFIGPIHQFNKRGYSFGLEILDKEHGLSPQSGIESFAQIYTHCDSSLSIITTAAEISPINKEERKKCSPLTLLNGTIEKVKSAIGPSSSLTGSVSSNTSSLKGNKKAKKNNTPSAEFYDNIEDNSNKNNMLQLDSEEYKQSIENREKSSERRATNTAQTQTQPQGGILKTKHKDQTKSGICTIKGKDIVIIDQSDIDELEGQKHNVTIVNNTNDIELQKLLGDNWPPIAGTILNNQDFQNSSISGSSNSIKTNKSFNALKYSTGNDKTASDTNTPHNRNVDNKKLQNDPDSLPGVLNSRCNADQNKSLKDVPNTDLSLGSMVEVKLSESIEQLHGVIRWIGIPRGQKNMLIGVELEDDCIDSHLTTDGGYKGVQLFKCPAGRGIFVTSDRCSTDRRFIGACGGTIDNGICEPSDFKATFSNGFYDEQQTFGNKECPIVPGAVAPIKCSSLNGLKELCGKFKGIQGHHNSCYLDVTLFSMFAFTPVFDAILYRPPERDDISDYTEVQTVLREEIVNPLRKNMFVRADRVMKLRKLLDKLSSVSGLMSEEKDPEEFLNCLLSQIMRAEPFLKLNSGQDAYYYQLFVEKDDCLSFPSVQQLFEQSFYTSDIKLKEVPSCLIIQMPRFGKNFKMYPRILPSQVLDITDIIEDSPRQCSVCGELAEAECRDCFKFLQGGVGLECTSFCSKCVENVHKHVKRENHNYRKLSVPQDFLVMARKTVVPRLYMELFAVVCIETSHYVAFVKAGAGPDAPWCFFDSMADRKGELNGYNIPEMMTVPDLPQWLSDDGARMVNETSSNDKMLPEHAKRLFCDAYMCMYQSTDVMMYR